MDNNTATIRFNAEMMRRYGITTDEAGIDADGAVYWATSFDTPEEGAIRYGEEYDLTDVLREMWMKDLAHGYGLKADEILRSAGIDPATKEKA